MKKFFVCMIACFVCALCAVGFTACDGGEQPEGEPVRTEITEEEVETALELFYTDDIEELSGLKFVCEAKMRGLTYEEEFDSAVNVYVDIDKKIIRLSGNVTGVGEAEAYIWEASDGVTYSYYNREIGGEEKVIEYGSFAKACEYIFYESGKVYVLAFDLKNCFSEFSYDEGNGVYTKTFEIVDNYFEHNGVQSSLYDGTYDVCVGFENGNVSSFSFDAVRGVGDIYAEYKYGYDFSGSLTVPENVLNMPLTQN